MDYDARNLRKRDGVVVANFYRELDHTLSSLLDSPTFHITDVDMLFLYKYKELT